MTRALMYWWFVASVVVLYSSIHRWCGLVGDSLGVELCSCRVPYAVVLYKVCACSEYEGMRRVVGVFL